MILYVDETGNNDFFIVAGVLFESEKSTKSAYKQFKKKVDNLELKSSIKEKLYIEFKGILLESSYQRIKQMIMSSINENAEKVVYGIYKRKQSFPQEEKEMAYIQLLSSIVDSMEEPVEIVFDEFKIKNFDNAIVNIIGQKQNCISIIPKDSQIVPGLQFADNVCGAIRLYSTGENEDYYLSIRDKIFPV